MPLTHYHHNSVLTQAIDIAAGMSVGRSPFLRIDTPFRNGNQSEQDPTMEKRERNNKRILEERALLFKTVGNSDHALLGESHDNTTHSTKFLDIVSFHHFCVYGRVVVETLG